ncbi:hypothetical protein H072_185 [Dactylellina haptotyla CBS 200.50]|uniref:BTB domain-containing protein n=1 Tax=Dactylellina haptotyla (strain CBS 200.50) TaxID=1284197 RepID=S8AS35_DACHA|nr:hypothetical protein H072_185 [Dactylellina haptotyla CBS 200.50]
MDDLRQPLLSSPRGRKVADEGMSPHVSPRSQPTPKSANPPRRPPSSRPPAIPPDSLLKLLSSHQYSDVTVIVGTGENLRIYRLHRNIICTKSRYLQSACQYHMLFNTQNPQIQLPELLPPIFDIVLEWIYGDILVLEVHQPLILSLYRATTFLQLHGLKIQIAKQVAKMLKHKRKNGTAINFDGFEIVRGMFEHAGSPSYFTSLRKCTDELALANNIPPEIIQTEILKGNTVDEWSSKFWMALAVSYQKALHATVCSECRAIVTTRTSLDRQCCHCSDSELGVPHMGHPGKNRVRFNGAKDGV